MPFERLSTAPRHPKTSPPPSFSHFMSLKRSLKLPQMSFPCTCPCLRVGRLYLPLPCPSNLSSLLLTFHPLSSIYISPLSGFVIFNYFLHDAIVDRLCARHAFVCRFVFPRPASNSMDGKLFSLFTLTPYPHSLPHSSPAS